MNTMRNIIPNTPRSCIEIMADSSANRAMWDKKWTKFYNIYFNYVRICVINRFAKFNWKANETLVNETIMLVFYNIIKAVKTYDITRTRFHIYLFGIIRFTVLQAIESHKNDKNAVVFDENKNEIKYFLKEKKTDDDMNVLEDVIEKIDLLENLIAPDSSTKSAADEMCEEEKIEARHALYNELIEETKSRVSPRMASIFEMRVVEGLSAAQVAKKLTITETIVDNDKHRFIKKLNEIASEEPWASEIKSLKE